MLLFSLGWIPPIETPAKSLLVDFGAFVYPPFLLQADNSCVSAACAPHANYESTNTTRKLSITYGEGSPTTGMSHEDTVLRTSLVLSPTPLVCR
jgi:hypothetical protein